MSTPEPGAAEPAPAVTRATTEPEPLDVDGVGVVLYGTIAWSIAFVLCVLLRMPLAEAGRGWWTWVCATGALLGLAGLVFVRRRRAAYAAVRH